LAIIGRRQGFIRAVVRYVLREIPADGDKPSIKTSAFETIGRDEKWGTLALIVTASHTGNDMSYGSGAEARL
jgi:hypothetical protein